MKDRKLAARYARALLSALSDPARAEALTARVFEEIRRLQTDGPGPLEVGDVREILRRDLEESLRENGFLLSNIAGRYQSGEDVATLFELDALYAGIETAMIHDALRRYLDMTHYVEVTLVPED